MRVYMINVREMVFDSILECVTLIVRVGDFQPRASMIANWFQPSEIHYSVIERDFYLE